MKRVSESMHLNTGCLYHWNGDKTKVIIMNLLWKNYNIVIGYPVSPVQWPGITRRMHSILVLFRINFYFITYHAAVVLFTYLHAMQFYAPLLLTALRTSLPLLYPIIIMYLITPTTIFDIVLDNFPNTLLAELRSRWVSSRPHIVAWREENLHTTTNAFLFTPLPCLLWSILRFCSSLIFCVFSWISQ